MDKGGDPLGGKMSGRRYQAKKPVRRVKDFLRAQIPP